MAGAVQVRPRPTGTPVGRGRRRRLQVWFPYLLLIPAILFELLIHIIPMIVGVAISFLELTQLYLRHWQDAPFAHLDNYRLALNFDAPAGEALLHSFAVTAVYTILVLLFSWVLGMIAAVLTQRRFPGRGLVRTIFLIPFALPVFASAITWNFMGQRNTGAINHVLVDQLHLVQDPPFWLIGGNSLITIVVMAVWRTWPFAFLIITAGMQSIPAELYEAAAIDGAGVLSQIRRVTLPLLTPVNRVLFLVLFLWTFNDFTMPYTLFGATPPREADMISIHIYQASFATWDFGAGSAMSVLLLLFLLVVTGVYLAIANRRTYYA